MGTIVHIQESVLDGMLRWVILIFILMTFSGCAIVKPWEREYLADDIMTFDVDALQSSRHLHMSEVLEGSRGGFSGSGGGCGCK